MATLQEIFDAAKAAVRDEVRHHRPNQRVWTTMKPSDFGLDGDTWVTWADAMIKRFNAKGVKSAIDLSETKCRGFLSKPLLDFAAALRDA